MNGISDNKLRHIIGVARRCYEIAKEDGKNESIARKLFLIGYLHDVGYEFAEYKEEHPDISNDLLINLFDVGNEAIKNHGKVDTDLTNYELVTLNKADLTVDAYGMKCTVYERLCDIKSRYGKESRTYKNAVELAKKLELIDINYGKEIEPVKLNKNGVNANIKAHILSDERMKAIGFTEHRKGYLYFSRILKFNRKKYGCFEISFSITIPRDGSDIRIDVLDEEFCQPYDYQRILFDNPEHKTALIVKGWVEEQMRLLNEDGVITGHEYGEYI